MNNTWFQLIAALRTRPPIRSSPTTQLCHSMIIRLSMFHARPARRFAPKIGNFLRKNNRKNVTLSTTDSKRARRFSVARMRTTRNHPHAICPTIMRRKNPIKPPVTCKFTRRFACRVRLKTFLSVCLRFLSKSCVN
jgi:hypothetical protein